MLARSLTILTLGALALTTLLTPAQAGIPIAVNVDGLPGIEIQHGAEPEPCDEDDVTCQATCNGGFEEGVQGPKVSLDGGFIVIPGPGFRGSTVVLGHYTACLPV